VERDSSWHAAFQYMVRWVETGTPPPPDSVVTVVPGSVTFPADASSRKGIQPTVQASANGQTKITVATGTTVALDGVAQSPIGKIARYDWDFQGNSQYDCSSDAASGLPACSGSFAPGTVVSTPASFTYTTPGTYTATLRVHDDTDNPGPFDGLENLSRVVIIVQ
jgi:PKD domain